jgi:hypothetical protein
LYFRVLHKQEWQNVDDGIVAGLFSHFSAAFSDGLPAILQAARDLKAFCIESLVKHRANINILSKQLVLLALVVAVTRCFQFICNLAM